MSKSCCQCKKVSHLQQETGRILVNGSRQTSNFPSGSKKTAWPELEQCTLQWQGYRLTLLLAQATDNLATLNNLRLQHDEITDLLLFTIYSSDASASESSKNIWYSAASLSYW